MWLGVSSQLGVSSHPITVWAHTQSHKCEQNYIFVRLWINSCYYLLMRVKMSLWALSCVNSNENESVGGVTPSGFHGVSSHPITKMVWAHTGFPVVWTHTKWFSWCELTPIMKILWAHTVPTRFQYPWDGVAVSHHCQWKWLFRCELTQTRDKTKKSLSLRKIST